jgi:hypothetical protein
LGCAFLCRPVEHSTVKQRFLRVLKSVYKIKFFIIHHSFRLIFGSARLTTELVVDSEVFLRAKLLTPA